MKTSITKLGFLVCLIGLGLWLTGCYTQLASTRGDDGSYGSSYQEPRSDYQTDTTYDNQQSATNDYNDYDDWSGHYRVGFNYYYPSYWYWDFAFGDPYFYGSPYGYPGYYGYWGGWNPYMYGYNPYGYSPYRYYNGYPFVVYGGSSNSSSGQTRNSGYRRTGYSRYSQYTPNVGAYVGASISTPAASRRSGVQSGNSVSSASKGSAATPARGAARTATTQPRGTTRTVTAPNRSGSSSAPSARSAPSGGSRSSGGSSRSSGSSRGRGTSQAPGSSYYRPDGGAQRSSVPYYAPRSAPSPSYSPAPRSSSTPSGSSAPASSSPSSGGSSGGSRSSGATRSGRN